MEPSEEFATGVAPRAVLREAGVTARASTDRLWLIPILRCELRFIPVEIVPQHIMEKRNTFLCDHSVLYPDGTSRRCRAKLSRTAGNQFPRRLADTCGQDCPAYSHLFSILIVLLPLSAHEKARAQLTSIESAVLEKRQGPASPLGNRRTELR